MLLKRPSYNAFFCKVPLENVVVKFDVFFSFFLFQGDGGRGGVGEGGGYDEVRMCVES